MEDLMAKELGRAPQCRGNPGLNLAVTLVDEEGLNYGIDNRWSCGLVECHAHVVVIDQSKIDSAILGGSDYFFSATGDLDRQRVKPAAIDQTETTGS
jgi:hypothetical protein